MSERQEFLRFKELQTELFKRAVGAVTAFRSPEVGVSVNWKTDGPLLETLGLITILEEKIAQRLSRTSDGTPEFIDPEDELCAADLECSTTVALRDEMCKLFPTVVVGYLLPRRSPDGFTVQNNWIGQPVECLGLLRWMEASLRKSADIFDTRESPLETFPISVLEVRTRESGQIKIVSGADMMQAVGYASLAQGKAAELVQLSRGG